MPDPYTIKIRFFSSFCDSFTCKTNYENVFETKSIEDYGTDKKIYITCDDDYTHAVIINTAMPVLKEGIPKENVIGIAFEPIYILGLTAEFVEYAKNTIHHYYIGDKKDLPDLFQEHYAYMWHIFPLTYLPIKNKLMSIMISEKAFAPGHKYRHDLVINILNNNLPIDIYGRGCEYYLKPDSPFINNERLKGEFDELEPYENYHFHICIENFQCNQYFSEKIVNSLLCSTTPIYLGCKNINQYFSDNVICLTGDLLTDLNILVSIINNPDQYKKSIDVNKIKKITNFFDNFDTLFK